jgi:hypothetical protein
MPLRMRGQRAAASMVGEPGSRNDHGASEREHGLVDEL